ncbi:DM13 domain-containing protein [Ramlibacter monticola]|uniref:DM13 domain-containing protein n=1 Tax=Ramlibacter monticola TaxID=1926872 RepID=A0A937CU16_9BURK|nr:DM13 domain-containing protein [Ramlibacter monticola]MBL0391562.1 DM13 domain-containing protein [Ramlibacter monticola]
MKILLLSLSYLLVFGFGFGLGVYLLPILAAPPPPTVAEVQAASQGRMFSGTFRRDLKGSDAFHWGEGQIVLTPRAATFTGRLAPGPAYKLYLVHGFVEDEDGFRRAKAQSLAVGDIKTFDGFIVPLPAGAAPQDYDTAVIWCEAFSRFITAAKYR